MPTNLTMPTSITAFKLKGGLYTLTTLQLLHPDLSALEAQLQTTLEQAPQFFRNAPVVLDFKQINSSEILVDFVALKVLLLKYQLIPIGIKNANESQKNYAIQHNFAILQSHSLKKSPNITPQPTSTTPPAKIITEPVRSGQQVCANHGDLIVLSAVSHGAELLAHGNIHVYASLRGRALAGIHGNDQAQIFCQQLEAELVSIAGQYKISEDIDAKFIKKSVRISLQVDRLQIDPL